MSPLPWLYFIFASLSLQKAAIGRIRANRGARSKATVCPDDSSVRPTHQQLSITIYFIHQTTFFEDFAKNAILDVLYSVRPIFLYLYLFFKDTVVRKRVGATEERTDQLDGRGIVAGTNGQTLRKTDLVRPIVTPNADSYASRRAEKFNYILESHHSSPAAARSRTILHHGLLLQTSVASGSARTARS